MQKTYKISGMDCAACAKMLELDLEDVNISATCDFAKAELIVNPGDETTESKVKEVVENSGFKIV